MDEKVYNRARAEDVFHEKMRQERNVQKRQSNFSRFASALKRNATSVEKVTVVVVTVTAAAALGAAETVALA